MPAHAKATVTIELPIPGSWGGECDLAQVYRQARDEAEGAIRNKLGQFVTITSINIQAIIVPEK